jgi:hypothetical protein
VGGRKEENLMADLSLRADQARSSNCSSPATWKAPARISLILAVTAFGLAGCNANQTIAPASQRALGDIYPNYSPYNPIEYAQTSGFYGGR